MLLIAVSLLFMGACKPSDSQISQAVQSTVTSLAPDVTASVDKGQVTLEGTVADQATKEALNAAVKKVKGVVTVTDNTTVQAAASAAPVVINPDDIVRNTIDSALQASGISGVNIEVSGGTVTLSGEAARKDLQKIMQIANESHPAKVVNQLTIH